MSKVQKVLFTGKTHTIASRRTGGSQGGHGTLDIQMSSPGVAGQEQLLGGVVPHPTAERLFAGAWSACYTAALGVVAAQAKQTLPPDLAVNIEVDLGQTGPAWLLQARIHVVAPGLPLDVAERLAHGAHEICPYSKATRGNIEVALTVATS
jgi:Ohr subfamily peroxiredoxin